jgi:hypothetical protein
VPHPQRRRSARCSVTHRRSRGRSNTCRASVPTTAASGRSAPQVPHRSGACLTTSSGSSTCARCAPGAPGCLPGRRPSACSASRRSARAGLRSPSEDGGFEELEESLPSRRSSSPTRASSAPLAATSLALAARNSTMTAAWTAMIASRSGSVDSVTASRTTSGQARLPWAVPHSYISNYPTVKPAASQRQGPEQLRLTLPGWLLAGRDAARVLHIRSTHFLRSAGSRADRHLPYSSTQIYTRFLSTWRQQLSQAS